MNNYYEPHESSRLAEARESFSGRLLTDGQFNEAVAITGIIEAEIYKSGTFKEKLADYAYAFARTESFDVVKAETILRDLYKARTGQTMNQLRESLMDRESGIDESADELAKEATRNIHAMIKDGDKMPFHRAYDSQAGMMAGELGITQTAARRIMCDVFREEADGELYDWGRELEEKYYRPQIEAEKAERRGRQDQSRGRKRSNTEGSLRQAHGSASRDKNRPRSRARQPA
ncbi:hypothetical protein B7H23_01250 [Notoacmeibacter marinus]|uniref:Uncharacterized protein n=1 Tax=Notoacmeibacter marinus TaxID=1876515 RepID=A0A231V222_9HYPH|nr:hypothetical protein [Notoacmeibacter marinus]OXT01626.1 hypothetical protein B7H23_01250 [Notoacmeibacter marinus]